MADVRRATLDDLDAIASIYNEAIERTVATFDTEKKTLDEMRAWFEEHGPRNPVIVAEEDGVVVGWGSLSRWSDRCAYSDTAELSLYVSERAQGRGIGRELLAAIVSEGREAGLHVLLSRITEGNDASVHLHESMGFERVGTMREVGRKFGRLLDVELMQLTYPGP